MDSVTVLLRAREHEKRSYRVIQKTANEAGTITIFTPFVLSDSGATDLAELMARSDHREDLIDMDSLLTLSMRAREQEKRSHRAIQKTANEAGTITMSAPFVLSDSGAMDLELSPVTAQDDAAPTAAHNSTPALAHHSRRFAARQLRLLRAIKTAAADGAGRPDDSERARGAAAWATQGDMISPGPWAVAGGGGGGGGVACGESGSSLFVNSYLHTPFLCPPPCHSPQRPADHPPSPPVVAINRTAHATAPPQDQDPRELGDLN